MGAGMARGDRMRERGKIESWIFYKLFRPEKAGGIPKIAINVRLFRPGVCFVCSRFQHSLAQAPTWSPTPVFCHVLQPLLLPVGKWKQKNCKQLNLNHVPSIKVRWGESATNVLPELVVLMANESSTSGRVQWVGEKAYLFGLNNNTVRRKNSVLSRFDICNINSAATIVNQDRPVARWQRVQSCSA